MVHRPTQTLSDRRAQHGEPNAGRDHQRPIHRRRNRPSDVDRPVDAEDTRHFGRAEREFTVDPVNAGSDATRQSDVRFNRSLSKPVVIAEKLAFDHRTRAEDETVAQIGWGRPMLYRHHHS